MSRIMTFVFVAMMLAFSSHAFAADAAQAVYVDWAKIIFVAASIIAAGSMINVQIFSKIILFIPYVGGEPDARLQHMLILVLVFVFR